MGGAYADLRLCFVQLDRIRRLLQVQWTDAKGSVEVLSIEGESSITGQIDD